MDGWLRRRDVLGLAGVSLLGSRACGSVLSGGALVNDVHSGMNPTWVKRVVPVRSTRDVVAAVRRAAVNGETICVCGGRHAMGGQQFGSGGVLLDLRGMDRVVSLDGTRGVVEVEAGADWVRLVDWLVAKQRGQSESWGIRQKQTGADRLTIGGALAANVHGRGLTMRPIVADVEAFEIVLADGDVRVCSRTRDAELFSLVIGGYGVFGVVTRVWLRLSRRRTLRRVVRMTDVDRLMGDFASRIGDGFLYGDAQFAIDPASDGFLHEAIFSCYEPVADDVAMPAERRSLRAEDWRKLVGLAHTDKGRAFGIYKDFYLSTDGQLYWSDTHQMSVYLDDYHAAVDAARGADVRGAEMITELYVPRDRLATFMGKVREDFRRDGTEVIYGTIRLIERDGETFLAWARESYACVIFNVHIDQDAAGIAKGKAALRKLIDRAMAEGGRFYLTYHRFAGRGQVEGCFPQMGRFVQLKQQYDPGGRFGSNWYGYMSAMFG